MSGEAFYGEVLLDVMLNFAARTVKSHSKHHCRLL